MANSIDNLKLGELVSIHRDNGDISYCTKPNQTSHPQMVVKIVNYLFKSGKIWTSKNVSKKDLVFTIHENAV